MTVKLGLIGAGGIARAHLKNIDALTDRVKLVAVADVAAERAKTEAEPRGATAYASADELLAQSDAEAVLVCIPPFAHEDLEERIAKAGKHVMVEKPVGLDLARAQANAKALENAKVVAAGAYHFRHVDGVEKARAALAGKKISLVKGQWIGGCPGAPWWRVKAQSGGQHFEQTTHMFDLARYLVGEVATVAAVKYAGGILTGVMENYDVEEATCAQLVFANGAIGTIESANVVKKGGGVSLTVFAQGLTVQVGGGAVSLLTPDGDERVEGGADPKRAELVAFLDAIEKNDPSAVRSTFSDAVKSLALTAAIDRALASGARETVG